MGGRLVVVLVHVVHSRSMDRHISRNGNNCIIDLGPSPQAQNNQ